MSVESATVTVGEIVQTGTRTLQEAGVENARLDAWLLAAHAIGVNPDQLRIRPDTPVDHCTLHDFDQLIRRRAEDRAPVSRLVGEREFWSLRFRLSTATLDPRPDSETLIEAAIKFQTDPGANCSVLDLGTGTGCLLLALLSEWPNSWGLGIDRSESAIRTARENARLNGLSSRAHFAVADWAAAVGVRFDVVVSNPPYIRRDDLQDLAPEVRRHDPVLALDGGPDGLDAYRAIAALLPMLVSAQGRAVLEIGDDQSHSVRTILKDAGMKSVELFRDLSERPRCLVATVGA